MGSSAVIKSGQGEQVVIECRKRGSNFKVLKEIRGTKAFRQS
jgi:hypothetical protein